MSQNGQPIAFFSRTLQQHEKRHPPIEKEAAAIIEACKKWRHYLMGRHFILITDQEAVSFVFDINKLGKTENDKILRWRVELSCFNFDIHYRPGKDNAAADCISRAQCSAIRNSQQLIDLHDNLCHPGVSRLGHFVRSRNLPYSMEDVKAVVSQCRICAKLKPQFYRPSNPPLIKATQPLQRLSIDFKGPLPSVTKNKYILTVVDEFSRFPFAFPSANMTALTIMKHLFSLFSIFGLAGYVHSDQGPSLVSDELRTALLKLGIGYSNSSPYNPQGNGQVERYNGTIWKAIELATQSKGLTPAHWELVLPPVMHSIRTLVCTSTNETPHERLFAYQRRTMMGHSLPTWLTQSNKVLMKKHVRQSKYDDICEEVDLIDVTPTYARVRLPTGREQTVSLRDLARLPEEHQSTMPTTSPCDPNGSLPVVSTPQVPHNPVSPLPVVPVPQIPSNPTSPLLAPQTEGFGISETQDQARPGSTCDSTPGPPLRRSQRARTQTQFYQSETS